MKKEVSYVCAGALLSWAPVLEAAKQLEAVLRKEAEGLAARVINLVRTDGRVGQATFSHEGSVYSLYADASGTNRREWRLVIAVRPEGVADAVCHSLEDVGIDGVVDIVAFDFTDVPVCRAAATELPEKVLREVKFARSMNGRLRDRYLHTEGHWKGRYDAALRAALEYYAKK